MAARQLPTLGLRYETARHRPGSRLHRGKSAFAHEKTNKQKTKLVVFVRLFVFKTLKVLCQPSWRHTHRSWGCRQAVSRRCVSSPLQERSWLLPPAAFGSQGTGAVAVAMARVSPPCAARPPLRGIWLCAGSVRPSVRLAVPQVGSGLGGESPRGGNIPWGWPRST